jgi:DNA sulfur modification protein DndD
MKLIHAHIRNFRILRDLKLDFSTDSERPLTVIRAANETGKTTAETALIWGLYGSYSLPSKGANFPLYPSDSLAKGQRKVEISVEIEFETEQVLSTNKGQQRIENVKYRLLRICSEYPSTNEYVKRESESVVLFRINDNGTERILDSEVKSIVENSIPEALKDVYFTDGDSAMSFIEAAATQGAKRKRVKDAIEALLGLQVLENTIKHLDNVAKKFQSKIDNTDYADKLEEINDQLDGHNEDIEEWSQELTSLEDKIKEGDKKLEETKRKIEDTLKLGDKEKLAKEIREIEANIKRNIEGRDAALKKLSSLIRSPDIAASMIMIAANEGLKILNEKSAKKQLPKINIPILEELLDRTSCFCGSDLTVNTTEGIQRRKLIEHAIENSRSADALQQAATSLFFGVRSELFDSSVVGKWKSDYRNFSADYENKSKDVRDSEAALKGKKAEIDLINDKQLIELRSYEQALIKKLNDARVKAGGLSTQISNTKSRISDLEHEQLVVENKLSKTDTSANKLKLTRLTKNVFESVFDHLRKDEVKRVSHEMNRIFLDMIGSDPETNKLTTITKAELTEEFDILVYGSNGHKLNPDQDLNGASRRAITLAFILALTKVSEVKAPNVIDTPLGMMSGFVKQSVLNKTLEEGTQVILFLTHDEIQGVETILDKKAGKIYTLTNPAHSKMLVNPIAADNIGVIRCECNHRTTCAICARKNIDEVGN